MILVGITEGILIGADPGALFLCFLKRHRNGKNWSFWQWGLRAKPGVLTC